LNAEPTSKQVELVLSAIQRTLAAHAR